MKFNVPLKKRILQMLICFSGTVICVFNLYGQQVITIPTTFNWYVSAKGKDTNAGTQAAPFRTIQYAINKSVSGQAIKVAEGRYDECINFNGKSIKLIGNPGNPASTTIGGNWQTEVVRITTRENNTTLLCGFTLTGNSGGATIQGSSSPVFSDLIITGNSNRAAISTLSATFTMQNTLVFGNNALSDVIDMSNSNVFMYNVTIADNKGTQTLRLSSKTTLTLRNSIIYNPTVSKEIIVEQNNYLNAHYCNIRGGNTLISNININTVSGIQNAPPVFVDPPAWKYQLSATSPCIDAGDPAAVWNDVNLPPGRGTARNDLGAYGWRVAVQPYQVFEPRYIGYTYDASGNQSIRDLIILKNRKSALKSASAGTFDDEGAYELPETEQQSTDSYEEVMADHTIVIYPNPTQGALNVTISGSDIPPGARIYLYHATGNLLKQWTNISFSNDMDLFSYPAGIYIMHILLGEKTSVWKIAKE